MRAVARRTFGTMAQRLPYSRSVARSSPLSATSFLPSSSSSSASSSTSLLSSASSFAFVPSAFPPHTFRRSAFTYPSSRTLDEIVKLPLLVNHTKEEIIEIWNSHHRLARNAATTSDFINAKEYETFVDHAKKAPLFVVPSFQVGFETMIINVQQSSILITSLEEYRSKGASEATPYAVITLYSDMAVSKDLVLIRAEMMDVNVDIPKLHQLWSVIKRYYIEDSQLFTTHPESFNRKPNPTFDWDKYVDECKNYVRQLQVANPKTIDEEVVAQFVRADEQVKDADIETKKPSNQ